MAEKPVDRRQFIKYGAYTAAGALFASYAPIPGFLEGEAEAANVAINLTISEAMVEMVDKTAVYMWLFADAAGPSFPGPVIGGAPRFVFAGDKVTINVTNNLDEDHSFEIVGVPRTSTGRIPPGGRATVRFKAPDAGTYLYADTLNAPVNRVIGLHGAMVVRPRPRRGVNTPYTRPTTNVQRLFGALGGPDFPGDAWSPDPASPRNRERIWLIAQVDPTFNLVAQNGGNADNGGLNPADFLSDKFIPDYYTINGRTGAFSSSPKTAPDIVPEGFIGEPHLIRILNAGVATHSPHIHANHIYVLSVNNVVQPNVVFLDTFTLTTLEDNFQGGLRGGSRADWLLPFLRPPDISGPTTPPLRSLIPQELALTIPGSSGAPGVPQSPLMYPMHCHTEMSQTSIGGNYPHGLITHFIITGDVDKVPFPTPA